jgi:protein gp37/ParB-like chromosome segregation protein Spo0J
MTKLGPYEVHPFADKFPLLEGGEFEELVADIKQNGLREPIVLTNDKATLVDGRNRYRACDAAGVDLVYETLPARYTETMILDLIVSENVKRRHLNAGQLSMLALDYEKAIAAAAHRGPSKEKSADRPTTPSRSTDKAAKAVGAADRTVQRAKAVQRDAPDLADKVRKGELALDAAAKQAQARRRAEPEKPPKAATTSTILTLFTHTGEPVEYRQPKGKATFNDTKGDGISWAAWSWNPVTGCLHGCDYCYARAIAHDERFASAFPAEFTPLFHEERLAAPANTAIPAKHRGHPLLDCLPDCPSCAYRRVFVCSMADLYGRWVPDEWIRQVHASMLASPQWEYLLLTKFPTRYVGLDLPPNAWVGTSVDEQKRVRIAEDAFRKVDGVKVKWLSLEPLREPLEFTDLSMFDWVVIGAQTETRQPTGVVPAQQPEFEWVARITVQAIDAGCKVHHKPNLRAVPGVQWLNEYPE